mmetsp:Transcript_77514/g.135436  ORF Transcript_77514/g.135436 Transcript_77514/m.135436 type:complete len:286 (+) Transcript_77514:612-1469(+)
MVGLAHVLLSDSALTRKLQDTDTSICCHTNQGGSVSTAYRTKSLCYNCKKGLHAILECDNHSNIAILLSHQAEEADTFGTECRSHLTSFYCPGRATCSLQDLHERQDGRRVAQQVLAQQVAHVRINSSQERQALFLGIGIVNLHDLQHSLAVLCVPHQLLRKALQLLLGGFGFVQGLHQSAKCTCQGSCCRSRRLHLAKCRADFGHHLAIDDPASQHGWCLVGSKLFELLISRCKCSLILACQSYRLQGVVQVNPRIHVLDGPIDLLLDILDSFLKAISQGVEEA